MDMVCFMCVMVHSRRKEHHHDDNGNIFKNLGFLVPFGLNTAVQNLFNVRPAFPFPTRWYFTTAWDSPAQSILLTYCNNIL
jgi:hypothetical protein